MTERATDEIAAGDAFRRKLMELADDWRGPAPLWHGWALMDAFLAGIDYERKRVNCWLACMKKAPGMGASSDQ